MRNRTVVFLAGLLLASIVALGSRSWPLPADLARGPMLAMLSEATGLETRAAPLPVRLRFSPMPTLSLYGVRQHAPGGPMVAAARRVDVTLSLGDLARGALAATGVRIMDGEARGSVTEAGALARLIGGLGERSSRALGPVTIEESRLVLEAGRVIVFEDVSASFGIDGTGAYDATFQGTTGGEAVKLTARGPAGATAADGRARPFTLAVDSRPIRLSIQGETTGPSAPVRGRATLESADPVAAARWLGTPPPMSALAGRARIEGTGQFSTTSLEFDAARIEAGGTPMEGEASLLLADGRLKFVGTLAAETLDLARLLAPLAQWNEGEAWSTRPFDLDVLRATDIDIRLSVARARLGEATFDDLAISGMARAGRLELSVSRPGAERGGVRLRATAQARERDIELKIAGQIADLDLGVFGALGSWFEKSRGGLDVQADLDGVGRSPREIAEGLVGRVLVKLAKGEMRGPLIEALLRSAENGTENGKRRPVVEAGDLVASIWKGVLEVKRLDLKSGDLAVALSGRSSLADRTLDLAGAVTAPPPPKSTAPPRRAAVKLGGTWHAPTLWPQD